MKNKIALAVFAATAVLNVVLFAVTLNADKAVIATLFVSLCFYERACQNYRAHRCPPQYKIEDLFAMQDREWQKRDERMRRELRLHNVPETGGKHWRADA